MEQLPYIDEHSIDIGAPPDRAWDALVSVLRTDLGGSAPAPLLRFLRIQPSRWQGEWRGTPAVADTMPGFAVAETDHPRHLALSGRHRFSRYALVFRLEETGPGTCTLRAETRAEFPRLSGRIYRALVIGSRGHRLVVWRLLRRVARRA